MLITTGKNPGIFSREIAMALASAVPGSRVEFRGKRTLSSMISKARKLHFNRVCSIGSAEGKAASLSFLKIGDDGSWERLSPKISIRGVAAVASAKKTGARKAGARPASAHAKPVPRLCLKITGTKAKTLVALISPSNSQDAGPSECSRMAAGAKTISVFVGKKKIISIGVAYEN